MRFYSFVNFYFQGIHAGIQTGHAVHQMESKYRNLLARQTARPGGDPTEMWTKCLATYQEWSDVHKTIIVKKVSGADTHKALRDLYGTLQDYARPMGLPCVLWHEPSCNNCNTAVGIVIPESVYDCPEPTSYISNGLGEVLTDAWTPEYKLKRVLNNYSMAS